MLTAIRKSKDRKGFTLIELMIVIAIIGILAAIAIPQFNAYRMRGFNAAANADAKNAFTAAQAFFTDNPTGTVTLETLGKSGFTGSAGVTTTVADGTFAGLRITARHGSGDATFTVNAKGEITRSP